MSDGDPGTGMFPQMQVTAGDTTCSVKGVLGLLSSLFKLLDWQSQLYTKVL